jgi:hypothetical protein
MMINVMRTKDYKTCRRGAALLVVLFVVMVITILSLGFLSRSDVELACGQNMVIRTQMDYLAESGLEHAKGLVLSPQDISSEYWTGAEGQQLVEGSNDYYDIEVVLDDSNPDNHCNYIIDCNSYRMRGGEKIGRSSIRGELRLDPCIAYWVNSDTTVSPYFTINGDVYSAGYLINFGSINGDVFAGGTISGSGIEGRLNQLVAKAPVAWPEIEGSYLAPDYYIDIAEYSAENISVYSHPSGSFGPSPGNPAGIRYCNSPYDSISLGGNVNIEGTLVAGGLEVSGTNNVITATKNFPALVVNEDMEIYANGTSLEINGLAIIKGRILMRAENVNISVIGGLFIGDGIAELTMNSAPGHFEYYGILHNGPVWRPSGGQIDGALEFDGVDDYVQTLDSSSELQLTNGYTLSVWIKPDSVQKSGAAVFAKCDASGTTKHWALQFDSSDPKKLIVYHPDNPPEPQFWDTRITLNEVAGAWHHICIVRHVNNFMYSYLDGMPQRTGSKWDNVPGSGEGHFNIGVNRTASSDYVYKGLIDDVRIYDRAVHVDDIPPSSEVGLIGNWRLDELGNNNVTVTAAPSKTAVVIWSEAGVGEKWGQAAGAFFKSIKRK